MKQHIGPNLRERPRKIQTLLKIDLLLFLQFEQMDLEICSLPADDRPKFKTQLESFRAELKRLAKEFQSAKRRFIRKNDRFQFFIIMKVECG